MSQTYGMPMPSSHHAEARNAPVRYVVIIEGNGSAVARLMLETRAQVEEFEGGSPEVGQMIQGLVPTRGASGPEWDAALRGHTPRERAEAEVYLLPI